MFASVFAQARPCVGGSRIKQEKTGWVAVAPTLRSQQPEMPAAGRFSGVFSGFAENPFGWVAIARFFKGWVAPPQICPILPDLVGCNILIQNGGGSDVNTERKTEIFAVGIPQHSGIDEKHLQKNELQDSV